MGKLIDANTEANDANYVIEISDVLREATDEILQEHGIQPEGESHVITGGTRFYDSESVKKTASAIARGHTPEDAAHEFLHFAWDLISDHTSPLYDEEAVDAFTNYYKENPHGTATLREHFAQEAAPAVLHGIYTTESGPIRRAYHTARDFFMRVLDKIYGAFGKERNYNWVSGRGLPETT